MREEEEVCSSSALRVLVGFAVFVLLISAMGTALEALLLPGWFIRLATLGALAVGAVVVALYLYRSRGQESGSPSSQRDA